MQLVERRLGNDTQDRDVLLLPASPLEVALLHSHQQALQEFPGGKTSARVMREGAATTKQTLILSLKTHNMLQPWDPGLAFGNRTFSRADSTLAASQRVP